MFLYKSLSMSSHEALVQSCTVSSPGKTAIPTLVHTSFGSNFQYLVTRPVNLLGW